MAKKPKALPTYKFKGSTPTDIPKDERSRPGVYGRPSSGAPGDEKSRTGAYVRRKGTSK